MLPTIEKYAGPNAVRVQIGNLSVWFSYKTPVAFYHHRTGLVVRENDWSNTTGRHLNAIDSDKAVRYDSETFKAAFNGLLATVLDVRKEGY